MNNNKEQLRELIYDNDELLELFRNDATFNCSIEMAFSNNSNVEDALIFALINGYKQKNDIYNSFINCKLNCLSINKPIWNLK